MKDAAWDAASAVVTRASVVGMAGQSGRVSATSATVVGILVVGAGDDATEYVGTFREYSGQFLSVDVDLTDESQTRTANVIASRPRASIRHAPSRVEPAVDFDHGEPGGLAYVGPRSRGAPLVWRRSVAPDCAVGSS